jgi:hypothetical protein
VGSVLDLALPEVARDVARVYVVGFDPGGATGWCVLRMDWEKLVGDGFTALVMGGVDPDRFAWRVGEFLGSENHQVDMMMALLRGVWGDGVFHVGSDSDAFAVGIEDFILQMLSMDRSLLSPVRITAAFNYAGRALPMPRLVHSASDAKKTVTDERLHRWGLWSTSPHTRDATRHAALVARKFVEAEWRRGMLARMGWLQAG